MESKNTALAKPDGLSEQFLREAYAPKISATGFRRFIEEAKHRGLDIVTKEIWAIPGFGDSPEIIMPSISGYRKLADVTGLVQGTDGPYWCGDDGVWVDIWLSDAPPAGAKFTVFRRDREGPITGRVTWRARARRTKDGRLMGKWADMPAEMLAINAERQAWKLSGLIHNGQRPYDGLDPDEAKAIAMRRVHAVAREHHMDHDNVREVVKTLVPGVESLTDDLVDAEVLTDAADIIEQGGLEQAEQDMLGDDERALFLAWIDDAVATNAGTDTWKGLIETAPSIVDGWELLIQHAPTPAYARRLVQMAKAANVDQKKINAAMTIFQDRLTIKESAEKVKQVDARPRRPAVVKVEETEETGDSYD